MLPVEAATSALSIAQAGADTGLTSDALRYYERDGLDRLAEITEHLGAIDKKIGIYEDVLADVG